MASFCCVNLLSEITCATATQAIQPPTSTTTTTTIVGDYLTETKTYSTSVKSIGIWFTCAYSVCHAGIGRVRVTTSDGVQIYESYPSTSSNTKYVYIAFDLTAVNVLGGFLDVDYVGTGHTCNRARFNWGYAGAEGTIQGVANLDNGGDGGQRFNRFTLPVGVFPAAGTVMGGTKTVTTTTFIPTGKVTTVTTGALPPLIQPPPSLVVSEAKGRKVCVLSSGGTVCSGSSSTPPAGFLSFVTFAPTNFQMDVTVSSGTALVTWDDGSSVSATHTPNVAIPYSTVFPS